MKTYKSIDIYIHNLAEFNHNDKVVSHQPTAKVFSTQHFEMNLVPYMAVVEFRNHQLYNSSLHLQ